MRKLFAILILMWLLTSLFLVVGCGNNQDERISTLEEENRQLREALGQSSNEPEPTNNKPEPTKAEELIIVENTSIIIQDTQYKSLYPDMIQATIVNNSKETIRHLTFGFLAYDENGYPLKISWRIDFSGGEYVKLGQAEDVNVLPGGVFGEGVGWTLDDPHNIKYVLAKVYEATFYNGETWKNPNYNAWVKEFKEKPLPAKYRN